MVSCLTRKKDESDRTHIDDLYFRIWISNSPSAYYLMGYSAIPFYIFLHCYSLFHSP